MPVKKKYMAIHPHSHCRGVLSLEGVSLERVIEFDYFGQRLSDSNSWASQIAKSCPTLNHRAAAILGLAKKNILSSNIPNT